MCNLIGLSMLHNIAFITLYGPLQVENMKMTVTQGSDVVNIQKQVTSSIYKTVKKTINLTRNQYQY